ncbi:MAG TPA: ABC transporter permease [Blastocatellia bacterium]|nr:ABC transporter permease [Blastocatellia bacterium]
MNKILVIIKREYMTRVRTKGFVIGTILTPLLMLALVLLPAFLASRSGGERRITILDQSGDPMLYAYIEKKASLTSGQVQPAANNDPPRRRTHMILSRVEVPPDRDIEEVKSQYKAEVENNSDMAYIVLRKGTLEGVEPEYYSKSVGDFSIGNIERTISSAITELRLVRAGLDPNKVSDYIKPVDMKTIRIGPQGESEEGGFAAFIIPYAMLMFIYITVFSYGVATMRGVIEEKQSRIAEIVVSSATPTQMMMGKLFGIGLVGLTQVSIWALSFFLISSVAAGLLGAGASTVPNIPTSLLVYFVLFFVLGFFLFATLYVVVGAIVSTDEEAQQAQLPVMLLMVAPMLMFTMIMGNPAGSAAVAISMVPFFAPTLMMMRIAMVNPPFWQIFASMVLMVAAILIAVWFAAKIYRVGILMYGKRPSIAELGRWLRYS